MESFVAIMALVAASVIDPGIYFAMNSPARRDRHDRGERGRGQVTRMGLHGHARDDRPRRQPTSARRPIISRAGGAPTLAVGMAHIFSTR